MTLSLDTSKTLRPGLLVALSVRVAGNAKYDRRVLEPETIDANGTLRSKFETQKEVLDAAEQEAAEKVRGKARTIVGGACAKTAFGFLCPEADEPKLAAAIKEAQAVVDAFNETAKMTRVAFIPFIGRVAPDDEMAVKRINAEVRSLIALMEEGVANCDVKKIREAAAEAREIGQMLNPDAQARITIAIDAARATAKALTKAAKAGEQAAAEIDRSAIRKLTEVRTAFLDLDDAGAIATPFVTGRAVDLLGEAADKTAVAAVARRELEI